MFEAVADGMDGEGQQVHRGEHHGEVLFAVAEVVLEVVAVGLESGINIAVFMQRAATPLERRLIRS
jgi:hypothetical protein